MLIYLELYNAVKGGLFDHPKIEEALRKMALVVESALSDDSGLKDGLLSRLGGAGIEAFHPQLWRIDLARWDASGYTVTAAHEFRTVGYTLPLDLFQVVLP